jgi:TM2 domain-containing membrane protein YozV
MQKTREPPKKYFQDRIKQNQKLTFKQSKKNLFMKQLKITSLVILSVVLLFTSCSIEKRVHMSGYHLEWHKSNKSVVKNDEIKNLDNSVDQLSLNKIETVPEQVNLDNEFLASNSNEIILTSPTLNILNPQKKMLIQVNSILNTDCDVIILTNGQEIQAKVLEVGQTEVKYKNCDNQSGPTFSKNKSEIFMIKYPNGTSTVIEESKSNSSNLTVNVNTNSDNNSTNKSLEIAVLLWFFLGILGVHRFYLGHIGMGVLYLLTGGLCGIGWLIDGILFLTGGLKPKNGDYTN